MGRNLKNKRLFIFDVDGTLVDAYRAIERSLNFTRKKLGYSRVLFSLVKKSVGKGDGNFIATFFAKKDRKKALVIYRDHHRKALLRYSKLRPYTKHTLYKLSRRGKILSIASNRPRRFTLILLNKLKIKGYFDSIYCGDQVHALKPDPKILQTTLKRFKINKEDAVYIGDMAIDLETAKRAGIDAVYIKGGSSSLLEVNRYKSKKIISGLKEILEIYN